MQPPLVHDVLRERARRQAERVVLTFDDRTLTFGELDREVDLFVGRLGHLGVVRGTLVGLFLPNVPEMAIALLACARLGAIAVPTNVALKGEGLAYVFESTVREHLASGRLIRVLEAFCPPFPGLFLYYPSRALLAPKLQALLDFLKARRDEKKASGKSMTRARRRA